MLVKLAAESHVPCFQERVGTRHPGYMIRDRLPWRLRARPSATLHEIQVRPSTKRQGELVPNMLQMRDGYVKSHFLQAEKPEGEGTDALDHGHTVPGHCARRTEMRLAAHTMRAAHKSYALLAGAKNQPVPREILVTLPVAASLTERKRIPTLREEKEIHK